MSEWFAFETALLLSFETKLQLYVCFSLFPKNVNICGDPEMHLKPHKVIKVKKLNIKIPILNLCRDVRVV